MERDIDIIKIDIFKLVIIKLEMIKLKMIKLKMIKINIIFIRAYKMSVCCLFYKLFDHFALLNRLECLMQFPTPIFSYNTSVHKAS